VEAMTETNPTSGGYVELRDLPEFDLPPLDRKRDTNEEFVSDLVDVSNSVRKYLILAAGVRPSAGMDPMAQGVLMGHAVRLFKLYDLLCHMVSQRQGDFTLAIGRMIADTVINLRYLLEDPISENVDGYVRATLGMEKKLILEVEMRMQDPPLPIEQRLLRDARAFFDRAGVNPDDVKPGEWRWIDSSTKAYDLGLGRLYEFGFRGSSHSIHGTWHDLYYNHLVETDEGFQPRLRYSVPRPQILDAMSVLTLDALMRYVSVVAPEFIDSPLVAALSKLKAWFSEMGALHEEQRAQP
jgi:hypothetical protein